MYSDIDKLLARLDAQARDEVELLRELGPRFFSEEDLLQLRGRCLERQLLGARLSKANMVVGASSPSLILLAMVLGLSGKPGAAALLLKAFPFVFLFFLAAAWWIHRVFDSTGQMELLIDQIDEELQRRHRQATDY